MIIAAAILLSYVWNIDLIELSGRNTLPTRLLRGADGDHRDRADRRLRVAPHQGGHRPQANPDP